MLSKLFLKKVDSTITNEGKELINEFFITFSRFECALKTSITFANGTENKVEANWDKFITTISQNFDPSINKELNNAVDYLLKNPPKIQALRNRQLIWRDRIFQHPTSNILKLSFHIRDIRNNLFHGGKFNGNYEPDVSRNYILIKSSLIIFNNWLSLDKSVETDFLSSFN